MMNGLKTNFQIFGKKKESICNIQPAEEEDDFSWSESEFSDVESGEEDPDHYNDISTTVYHNNDDGADREDYYENFGSEVVKTNEMRKTPPTLPPRKSDIFPQPPARRKKEKKPPLPEKEDDQFYEEINQMTLESSSPVPPAKNVPSPPTRCQQNTTSIHVKEDDGDHQSTPPFKLPSRKMPAIPSMTSNDTTPPYKTSMSHCSVSSRPRIESPKEKPTENPLNIFRWYHGDSERMVVEKKLLQYKKDGMFAVRNSRTKGPSYPYAVTLYQNGKTYNFPIRIRDSDKKFAMGTEKKDEPSFETLDILIDYFKTNNIILMKNQSALLNIPLDRSS